MHVGHDPSCGALRRTWLLLCTGIAAMLAPGTDAQSPAPGHRVFGSLTGTDTVLVDAQGAVLHTWHSAFRPGVAAYVAPDGTLLRTVHTGRSTLAGAGGGLQRVALDGTVLWDYRYDGPGVMSHHDIAVLPNGNVLMVAWEDKTTAEAIAAGRDPGFVGPVFRPEHVIEVAPTGPTSGTIVWEWHVWDHLIQDFDPGKANFGAVARHPELVDINYPPASPNGGDWLHFNGIDHDPVHDRIVLSGNAVGEIWVIDHSTTTAEAAGHAGGRWGRGGDLLYRWGNPAAHRAGPASQRVLFGQHSPRFVPAGYPGAGDLLVFVNHLNQTPQSAVFELTPPLDPSGAFVRGPNGAFGPTAPSWIYTAPGFYSQIVSSCERLPNGNTLICSGTQGRVFEVTPTGRVVANATMPGARLFRAGYVDRALWVDAASLSVSAGGAVGLDLIAGTAHAGETYLVLGSISGTSPGVTVGGAHVPLNPDAWTAHTLGFANSPFLLRTLGFLDGRGRASASLFNLPSGSLPPALAGLSFSHAFVTVGATAGVTRSSNAVTTLVAR